MKRIILFVIAIVVFSAVSCTDKNDEDIPDSLPEDDAGLMAPANSYIISASGSYSFPAVKGGSTESVGDVASSEVLWESFGTDVRPSVGDLISSVSYSNGKISYTVSSPFKEGNAVIAAKDASGEILWSWHIWLTDQPQEQVYANNAGTMMDRNLGATSATPGDIGALGLLYQWGRKDPFLGSASIVSSVEAESTGLWPSATPSSEESGTIDYTVHNPMTLITYNNHNFDWYYTGSSSTDDSRWQSDKTIYDPCPSGWRVPDGGETGLWAVAGFADDSFDDENCGISFNAGDPLSESWYPAAGYRYSSAGILGNVGKYGYYWSVTPSGRYAYFFYFYYDDAAYPFDSFRRAYVQSVRCVRG